MSRGGRVRSNSSGKSKQSRVEGEMSGDSQEQLRCTRIALASLLKLVEDGVLVRNTANDGDLMKYMRQSTDLTLALKQAQEVL